MSSPTVSATEATRGTSQGGNAEERPGKRIQRAGSYDELGVSYKGKKGGLESNCRARGHLRVKRRVTGPRRQDLPFPWRGLAHRKPAVL